MKETLAQSRFFKVEKLEAFIKTAFMAIDMSEQEAGIIAELMADADLNGVDSHGIFRLPHYIRRLKTGGINLHPEIKVEREKSGMALVNGDNGMGHLVMKYAADLAVQKAKSNGVAWVGTKYSNHAGPASLYAKIPLKDDMIGLYVAIGNANHLPPWGGTEMLLSTNPIAIAVPAWEEAPVVLDMATTVSAYGKVKTAAQRGEEMPEGWMVDRQGKPLTDPNRAEEGFLLPIGGYKGYGLALLLGLLAGTLNGAAMGKDVVDWNADDVSVTNTGQFIVAISIESFAEIETFKRAVDGVVRSMQSSPTLPGFDKVQVPGEQSFAKKQERTANGIPMHEKLFQSLQNLASELKIEPLQ
ncbi:MAG: Ldh family oxidoreductase [SAR324 cluster bacterium]|nr:Ldh family oxidoreductase [SAR324 cluster bacterium]